MNKFFLLIISLFLVGCSAYKVVQVPVPITSTKPVKLPPKPDLPIYHLTEKSQPEDVAKAYVASITVLKYYIDITTPVCEVTQ